MFFCGGLAAPVRPAPSFHGSPAMILSCAYNRRAISCIRFPEVDMNTATIKESRLNIRCDLRARRLLDKAAAHTHSAGAQAAPLAGASDFAVPLGCR